MKYALILLTLIAEAALASGSGPIAQQPTPDLTWSVKSFFEMENQTTSQDAAKQAAQMQAQNQTANSLIAILAPVAESLSQVSSLDPNIDPQTVALTLFQASFKLTDAAKKLRSDFPELYTTINFVITPWDAKDSGTPGDFTLNKKPEFVQAALDDMHALQRAKFGLVSEGKEPIYLLGATASVSLSAKAAVAHLQAVLSLNPQTVPGMPPINIPSPLFQRPEGSTVMFVDVDQPLDQNLPQVEIRFGKIGLLKHEGWLWRFEVLNHERLCTRTWSTPEIMQDQPGIPFRIPLPLYGIQLDMNTQTITGADVRVGLLGLCLKSGYVDNQFIQQGNEQLAQLKASLTTLFGASPDDFAEIIKRQRQDAGVSDGPEDN